MNKDIDFAKALVLLHVIVEAGKHGPLFQKLASLAGEELKEMLDFEPVKPRVITPAAGPANGAIEQADGSVKDLIQPQAVPPAPPTPESNETSVDPMGDARRQAQVGTYQRPDFAPTTFTSDEGAPPSISRRPSSEALVTDEPLPTTDRRL